MEKEFVSSNDLDNDQLEEMLEKLEAGTAVEIDGAFSDQCYVPVIYNSLDPSGAKIRTQKRVERVKRAIELSRGRRNRKYRDF